VDNVAIPNYATNLVLTALAKALCGLAHFVCDGLEGNIQNLLARAARFDCDTCAWIEEYDLAASESESKARPRRLVLSTKPLTNAAKFLKRGLVLFPENRNSAKTNEIPERIDTTKRPLTKPVHYGGGKELRIVPISDLPGGKARKPANMFGRESY
jgi:hypothetical protein